MRSDPDEKGQRFDPDVVQRALNVALARSGSADMLRSDGNAARLKPAAVLVLIIERPDGPRVLLTERAMKLRGHPGQISFPGGRLEPDDADEAAAAVREAREEVGLRPEFIEILGRLRLFSTVTGYSICPIVAWAKTHPAFEASPEEVADIFEVPLAWLQDRRNHKTLADHAPGRRRQMLPFEDKEIWGVTAAILLELIAIIDDSLDD